MAKNYWVPLNEYLLLSIQDRDKAGRHPDGGQDLRLRRHRLEMPESEAADRPPRQRPLRLRPPRQEEQAHPAGHHRQHLHGQWPLRVGVLIHSHHEKYYHRSF